MLIWQQLYIRCTDRTLGIFIRDTTHFIVIQWIICAVPYVRYFHTGYCMFRCESVNLMIHWITMEYVVFRKKVPQCTGLPNLPFFFSFSFFFLSCLFVCFCFLFFFIILGLSTRVLKTDSLNTDPRFEI